MGVGSRHSSILACPGTSISINMVLNAFVPCLVCTATSFVNSKTTFGKNQVGVNFCCGEDERLVVDEEPGETKAKCVQIGDEEEGSSLEGKQVWVGEEDGDGGEMKSLKLMEVKNLDCQRGLLLTTLIMNQAAQNVSLTPHHRIPSVLTSGGDLQIKENRGWIEWTGLSHINAEDFCLAPLAQDSGDDYAVVALLCDTCAEQAACSYVRDTFYIYIFGTGTLFVPVCDTNGDNAVDFDEFFDKLKFYITTAFEVLDENEDGSILDEAKDANIFNSISYQFFEALLNEVFEFFDSNKDGALSVEDDFSEWAYIRDLDDNGKITLSDALGRSLISSPA